MLIPQQFPVTCQTKRVGPGSTFVAIRGFKTNGTHFIPEAMSRGATTIVIQQGENTTELEQLCKNHSVRLEIVTCARQELAIRAAQAFQNPATKLKLVGITGTKGKTTTTYLIEHILRHADRNTGLVGSIKNRIVLHNNATHNQIVKEAESSHATPGSDELQIFLAQCVQDKVSHGVIEVSSHALSLDRVYGIEFDIVGFTNLHHDHMDFYENMDDYFSAKIKLFNQVKPGGTIVINTDNEWGVKAFNHAILLSQVTIVTFGQQLFPSSTHNHRHVQFCVLDNMSLSVALEPDAHGISRKIINCPSLLGDFNGYNVVMAWLIGFKMGIAPEIIGQALETFPGVPGRMQVHRLKNGALGIVDYAHNPISLKSVLKFLRPITQHLIVVCGSGGDRDPSRRAPMGALAAQYADQIILTIGSPRSEDPLKIINDFLVGVPDLQRAMVIQEPHRLQAIKRAVLCSGAGSIVVILGQGHEAYSLIDDPAHFFNDFEEVSQY